MASKIASRLRNCSVVTATILALAGAHSSLAQVAAATSSGPSFGPNSRDSATQTPIKHVIIIIGENRTFDHVFATYVPVKPSRDTVWNLLSEGIVKADGTPGPSYSKAIQSSVLPPYPSTTSWPRQAPRMRRCRPPWSAAHTSHTAVNCSNCSKSFLRHRQRIATRLPTWRP